MLISDWSSDVCSSDLAPARPAPDRPQQVVGRRGQRPGQIVDALLLHPVEDRRGPNQYVGVPYRRHAVGGHRLDLHPRLAVRAAIRSEEHTSELQSLMRISYAVFCLKKKKNTINNK